MSCSPRFALSKCEGEVSGDAKTAMGIELSAPPWKGGQEPG